MKRTVIADERYGLRPLHGEPVLNGVFDGDIRAVRLENGCVIYADDRPNYNTADGRMFAEALELEAGRDATEGEVVGYVEVSP